MLNNSERKDNFNCKFYFLRQVCSDRVEQQNKVQLSLLLYISACLCI